MSPGDATRLRRLIPLAGFTVVLTAVWLASRAIWGLQDVTAPGDPHANHPFVHVINCSDRPVSVACWGYPATPLVLTLPRQRARMELPQPTGSPPLWTVHVRPLSLDGPDVVAHELDWSGAPESPRVVTIKANGYPRLEKRTPQDDPSGIVLRSDCEVPVKFDADALPWRGDAWTGSETERERATWLVGEPNAGTIGPRVMAADTHALPIRYRAPAVVDPQDIELPAEHGGDAADLLFDILLGSAPGGYTIEVAADRTVSWHEWGLLDELWAALGF